MYDPETGLSGSDLMGITCRHGSIFENCWQGKGRAGNMASHHINTRDGMDIWRFEHLCSRKINISSKKMPPHVAFRFCLQGETERYHAGIRKQFHLKGGQQDIFYSEDMDNVSSLPADIPLNLTCIFVSTDYLLSGVSDDEGLMPKALFSAMTGKGDPFFRHNRGITRGMQSVLSRMIHCPYSGITRKLFFESCALELMCLKLDEFREPAGRNVGPATHCRPLHPNERRRIRQIQERFHDNPTEIPSLTELAREAGMSQSTLSRLFRKEYGTTVFSYLRNTRLDLAAQMLSQGMSVTETAFSVGYNNLSYFSKEFKKRFGTSPSRF